MGSNQSAFLRDVCTPSNNMTIEKIGFSAPMTTGALVTAQGLVTYAEPRWAVLPWCVGGAVTKLHCKRYCIFYQDPIQAG